MNEVLITATASITGLGPDLDTTWRRLLAGETAVRPIRRFDAGRYPARNASWIEGLESGGNRSLLYPLLERLLDGFGPLPPGCRLVTATTKGCIDTFERVTGNRRTNSSMRSFMLPKNFAKGSKYSRI